jgi:type IV pilus biogenesis/stability protein PilW
MFIRGRMLPVWQGALIVLLVCLAYFPALRGGFVWDDDSWTTGIISLLRDPSGLRLIWFQPTALQQYYPLTATTFWLDYQLWNFWTTPYHVENVLLHALAALLFWRLLLRLQVPGAWLASALFALHPVMVESVAWITERKNVLSLALYLGALLAYLRYAQGVASGTRMPGEVPAGGTKAGNSTLDTRHSTLFYSLAFVLFLGALLAKTTTFSLPAVVLLIGWWRCGQIRWRTDVLPTLPFFALAVGLCAVTAWLEKYHVGAQGSDFDLTFPQRCLVAGRAFWFYLGHLFWPVKLCFVYPRWQPDPGSGWQWLYPVAAIGALFTLWLARERMGRGPATALFYFVGTLFPVLGFMNAYGMLYSFVWDHWVYLSALGIIVLVAALVVRMAETLRTPAVVYGFAAIVLPVLALLTWRQAGMYADKETLWRDTLAKNPDCWLACNNLGTAYAEKGRFEEAIGNFREAIRINPNSAVTRYNLGNAFAAQGRWDEAIENYRQAIQINPDYRDALNDLGAALAAQGRWEEAVENFRRAIRIKPNFADALNNLGEALLHLGRLDEAIGNFRQAIRIKPNFAAARYNLGVALAAQGRWEEAIENYNKAIQINPNNSEAWNNLGIAFADQGRLEEAIENFRQAIQVKPDNSEALNNLGGVLLHQGRFEEAIGNFRQAIRIKPNFSEALDNLGVALAARGRLEEAIGNFRQAIRIKPNFTEALNNLAWVLAASPDDETRDGAEAVRLAERVCELTHDGEPSFLGTLAAAYAEAGRFPEAVATAEKAEQLATAAGLKKLAGENRQRLELYRAGKPYHEPAPTGR